MITTFLGFRFIFFQTPTSRIKQLIWRWRCFFSWFVLLACRRGQHICEHGGILSYKADQKQILRNKSIEAPTFPFIWVCLQTETSNKNIPLLDDALSHESNHRSDFYHSHPRQQKNLNKLEGFFFLKRTQTWIPFHLKLLYQLQSDSKLWLDSVLCLQPSYISLIYTAWLHRRLSTYSVCSPRQWKAPDLLLTVLILGVTLWINSLLHSRKLKAATPPGSPQSTSKFHMGGTGGCKSNHFQSSE